MAKAKGKRTANPISRSFAAFAGAVSKIAGKPYVFILCVLVVLVWAGAGPAAGFSDTWQLIINTSTTIITFLMVFLIQNTQNRDNAAIQAKLDELIRVGDSQNKFIGIEHLSDEELEAILEEVEQYAEHLHAERRLRGAPSTQTSRKRSQSHAK
jgi:low affinity Fe/Cu permease